MPNAVYERTRVALTGLLPGRAATGVLDRALLRHHRSPDDVGPKEMATVLMKGVYGELKGVLPDPGLRHALRRVARDVAQMVPRGATVSQVRAARERVAAAAPAARVALEPLVPPTSTAPEAAPVVAVAVAPVVAAAVAPRPEAVPRRRPFGEVEAVLSALAEIEGVHGVGHFDRSGTPLEVRGVLPDAHLLGRVLAAGGSLLERRDALRSVRIDTTGGRLVAVPSHPHWIALTGTADLNLGAVYAALAALEEER